MLTATVSSVCLTLLGVALGDPCPGVGKLAATSGTILDSYGEAVTLTSTWGAVVSSRVGDGIVDLWQDTGAGWQLHDQLQPFELADVDAFRNIVASDGGDVIAFSAWDETGVGAGIGRVVVLRRSGLSWNVDGILASGVAAFPGFPGDGYGLALDVQGDRLVVGAPYFTDAENQQGRVHTYEYDGSAWIDSGTIDTPLPAAVDRFGDNLAVHGDRLVVTAPNVDNGFLHDGAAYLYERQLDAWILHDQVAPPTPTVQLGVFGDALAMSANHVFIGVPEPSTIASASGTVHIFEHTTNQLLASGLLDGTSEGHIGRTGAALDYSAGRLLVGAPTYFDVGAVHIYTNELSGWTPQGSVATCADFGDSFGESLGLFSDRLLVGAPGDDGDSGQSQNFGVVHTYAHDGASFAAGEELLAGAEVSASRGGIIEFHLWPGATTPGATYVMLGSVSGTSPGVTIQGHHIPLNFDPWFQLLLGFPSGGIFGAFQGPFSPSFPTKASLNMPAGLPPVLVGVRFDHAWVEVLGNQIQSVSEAEGFVFDL